MSKEQRLKKEIERAQKELHRLQEQKRTVPAKTKSITDTQVSSLTPQLITEIDQYANLADWKPRTRGKAVWKSKTLYVNLIALIALVAGSYGFPLPYEAQMGILAVVNIILRFVTSEPINWDVEIPQTFRKGKR